MSTRYHLHLHFHLHLHLHQVLHSTSWLPPTPGLGALATLVFAPQAELRTNPARTRLTGALTGLGPATTDTARQPGLHPDHDIETRFDVTVTAEDVDRINKIRYYMNLALSRTEPDLELRLGQAAAMYSVQRGVKKNLEELVGRERGLVEKEGLPGRKEHRWGVLKDKHRLANRPTQGGAIFQVCRGLGLVRLLVQLMPCLPGHLSPPDDRRGAPGQQAGGGRPAPPRRGLAPSRQSLGLSPEDR